MARILRNHIAEHPKQTNHVLGHSNAIYRMVHMIINMGTSAWKFSLFDNIVMEIGVNCMVMHVQKSKYGY